MCHAVCRRRVAKSEAVCLKSGEYCCRCNAHILKVTVFVHGFELNTSRFCMLVTKMAICIIIDALLS